MEQTSLDFSVRRAVRATDLVTSVMAAEQIAPHVHAGQMKALAVFYSDPARAFDDFELSERTGVRQTSIGKRRKELEEMGYVVRRERRPSPSRLTDSTVYSFQITDAGLTFYARESAR